MKMQCLSCKVFFPRKNLVSPKSKKALTDRCDHTLSYRCPKGYCCDHFLCQKCFNEYVGIQIKKDLTMDIDNVRCFSITVGTAFKKEGLKEEQCITPCLSKYSFDVLKSTPYIKELQNRYNASLLVCINCQNENKIKNVSCKKFLCEKCKQEMCRLCKKKYHIGLCKMPEREQILKTMKDCRPCPYCLEVISKIDMCDHMHCKQCENDFCYICSSRRSAIIAHGNHYHRKSCKYFSDFKDTNKIFIQQCKECVKYNEVNKCNPKVSCPQPGLLINYDIPEEELKMFGFD